MRKFAVIVGVMLAVATAPRIAGADPIGTNTCVLGATEFDPAECDLYADFDDGLSELGIAEGNLGGYLTAYTLLLNASADFSDGLAASEVAHILVVHDQLYQLYSNIATLLFDFNAIFASASSGVVDGNPASQILGTPVPDGVLQVNNTVGYAANADLVTLFPQFVGGQDTLRIHTARPTDEDTTPNPVPEPGTLSLLAFGGSAAAAAFRRRRAAKAN